MKSIGLRRHCTSAPDSGLSSPAPPGVTVSPQCVIVPLDESPPTTKSGSFGFVVDVSATDSPQPPSPSPSGQECLALSQPLSVEERWSKAVWPMPFDLPSVGGPTGSWFSNWQSSQSLRPANNHTTAVSGPRGGRCVHGPVLSFLSGWHHCTRKGSYSPSPVSQQSSNTEARNINAPDLGG